MEDEGIGSIPWVAPEILNGQPYSEKADTYSYAITIWEVVTRLEPYHEIESPLTVAVKVSTDKLRPAIPSDTHPDLKSLMERCWHHDPAQRPDFSEITATVTVD